MAGRCTVKKRSASWPEEKIIVLQYRVGIPRNMQYNFRFSIA